MKKRSSEHELLLPVKCPVCAQESLSGFRASVIAAASGAGVRLYANCHLVSWDATEREMLAMRAYLDDAFGAELQQALVSTQFSLAMT
jgi:hypothetical protein